MYDGDATLDEALDSVACQTFADYEVLLVLNGCTDRSPKIARARAARDPRIRPLERPRPNLVDALDAGLAAARGPLIARMDADDVAHRERLAAQAEWLRRHQGTDIVGSRVRLCDHEGASPARQRLL